MAKKIRFPLVMADGVQVRNLEDLREHFDLTTVLEYYKNGKLLTWLQDRYFDDEAAAVQALDEAAPDLQPKLCEIFGAAYTGEAVDLEEISRRQERLERLRTFTDEAEFIDHIDQVAFDQEELADLLDEGETTIYLCGEKFTVPASRKGMTYIGVNSPSVHISVQLLEDMWEFGIEFVNCHSDFEEITLSEPIHIAQGETCTYRNKIIHFRAAMECEGTLEFDACVLHYGEAPGAGQIHMTETASLSMRQCVIENHSYEERMFVDAENIEASIVFDCCKFLNCCSFLNSGKELALNQCKLDNPGKYFVKGRRDALITMADCEVLFRTPPAFLTEAYTRSEYSNEAIIAGASLRISMSLIKGDVQLFSFPDIEKEKAKVRTAPWIFFAEHITVEHSSFYGVINAINSIRSRGADISLSTFEHCLDILYYGIGTVQNCRFDNCSSIASSLEDGCQFLDSQFNNCFCKLIDTSINGGVVIKFCEFNNWSTPELECYYSSSAMLKFCRFKNHGHCSRVEECVFNGMRANSYYLIEGACDEWPSSDDVVYVKKCSFANCTSKRKNPKLIKEDWQVDGWFNTSYDVKTTYISGCTGLDQVNTCVDYNDYVTLKTRTSEGIPIGIPDKQ